MKKRIRHMLVIATLVVGGMVATQGAALAEEPFLCPVVGDAVFDVAAVNSDGHGLVAINPPVGASLLPGNNQAGANANDTAYNTDGPDNPDAGPGGNPDFSPIWPG